MSEELYTIKVKKSTSKYIKDTTNFLGNKKAT